MIWEYKIFRFEPGDKIVDRMNQFGAEGWEAFHFAQRRDNSTNVLFKRQRPSATSTAATNTGEPT